MKLRTKMMFAIVVSWTFVVFVIFVGSNIILKNDYKQLELEQAEMYLNKVKHALTSTKNPKIREKILDDLKLNATLYKLPDIKINPILAKNYNNLLNHHINMVPLNSQILLLYYLLKDNQHRPLGMLQIVMPREFNIIGEKTINYFNVALIIDGFILMASLFYLLQILIIHRLNKAHHEITMMTKTKDFSVGLSEEGSDELSFIIKEMNKMLKSIKNSEEILIDIINSMPSYIILVDDKLKIINLNKAAVDAIQVNVAKAIHQPLFQLFPFLAKYSNKFNEAISQGLTIKIEEISHQEDTEICYSNVIIYPFIHRKTQMFTVRIDDISEKIRLEKQLEKSNKLSSIGILMTDVLKAIDQPINLIASKIEMLKQNINESLFILRKYAEISTFNDLKIIAELEKTADITRNFVHTQHIIKDIYDNAEHVVEIVKNLKNKSRM